jgi:hypothetical protein
MLSTISLVLAAVEYVGVFVFGAQYVPSGGSFSQAGAYTLIIVLSGTSALLVGCVHWVMALFGTVRRQRLWWSFTILLYPVVKTEPG